MDVYVMYLINKFCANIYVLFKVSVDLLMQGSPF